MRGMSLELYLGPGSFVSRLSWCELHLLRGSFWNKLSDTSASRIQVSPLDHSHIYILILFSKTTMRGGQT